VTDKVDILGNPMNDLGYSPTSLSFYRLTRRVVLNETVDGWWHRT